MHQLTAHAPIHRWRRLRALLSIAVLRHDIAMHESAKPTRSGFAIAIAAKPHAFRHEQLGCFVAPEEATARNQQFGPSSLPIALCVHSIALLTRSGTAIAIATTSHAFRRERLDCFVAHARPPHEGGSW